jgi:hypothetical protein
MAFTPEDGTGLTGANAYIDVAFLETHHTDRGRDVTSLTTATKETAIVRATDYIDKRFGRWFRGVRTRKNQGLEWPRLDAFDNDDFSLAGVDDVPRQLQKACAEYALRAILYATELAPDPQRPAPTQDLSGPTFTETTTDAVAGIVRRREEAVGRGAVKRAITWTTVTEMMSKIRDRDSLTALVSVVSIPEYPEADMWIEELINPPATRRLVRGA